MILLTPGKVARTYQVLPIDHPRNFVKIKSLLFHVIRGKSQNGLRKLRALIHQKIAPKTSYLYTSFDIYNSKTRSQLQMIFRFKCERAFFTNGFYHFVAGSIFRSEE